MALQFAAIATGNAWVVAAMNAGLTKLNGGSWGDAASAGAKSYAMFQIGVPAPDTGGSGGSSGWDYAITAMRIGSQFLETGSGGGSSGGGSSSGRGGPVANEATTASFSYLYNNDLNTALGQLRQTPKFREVEKAAERRGKPVEYKFIRGLTVDAAGARAFNIPWADTDAGMVYMPRGFAGNAT